MPDITIDAAKAERMISEILRTEKRFLPADANDLAANICRRLKTAMATPTNYPLHGYRLIHDTPPRNSAFATAFAKAYAKKVDDKVDPEEIWSLVYEHARELPLTMVDP